MIPHSHHTHTHTQSVRSKKLLPQRSTRNTRKARIATHQSRQLLLIIIIVRTADLTRPPACSMMIDEWHFERKETSCLFLILAILRSFHRGVMLGGSGTRPMNKTVVEEAHDGKKKKRETDSHGSCLSVEQRGHAHHRETDPCKPLKKVIRMTTFSPKPIRARVVRCET